MLVVAMLSDLSIMQRHTDNKQVLHEITIFYFTYFDAMDFAHLT